MSLRVEVVVATGGIQSHVVRLRASWREREVVLVDIKTGFQQFAATEIVLVLDCADICEFNVARRSGNGLKWRKAGVLVVEVIKQEAGGKDIARGEVGLDFGQIAGAPEVVRVSIRWQLREDEIVVLAFERVEKPHFTSADRTGERDARRPLVEDRKSTRLN